MPLNISLAIVCCNVRHHFVRVKQYPLEVSSSAMIEVKYTEAAAGNTQHCFDWLLYSMVFK